MNEQKPTPQQEKDDKDNKGLFFIWIKKAKLLLIKHPRLSSVVVLTILFILVLSTTIGGSPTSSSSIVSSTSMPSSSIIASSSSVSSVSEVVITVDTQGGTMVNSLSGIPGATIDPTRLTTTRLNYEFVKFSSTNEGVDTVTLTVFPNTSMTIFAIWQGMLVNLHYASVVASPIDIDFNGFNFDANSVVVTQQGRLLAWGDNSSKQLTALVETAFVASAVDITEAFSLQTGEIITSAKVVTGSFNKDGGLIVLTSLGRVFTTGANHSGQLGIGTTSVFEATAQDITASFNFNVNERIAMLYVGVEVVFAKTTNHRYFAWGLSSSPTQNIPGFTQNVLTPTLLDFHTLGNLGVDETVVYFNFNFMNGFIITSRNRLLGWGAGSWGQIPGLNNSTNQLVDVSALYQLTEDEIFEAVYIGHRHVITIIVHRFTGIRQVYSQGQRESFIGFSATRGDLDNRFFDHTPLNITSIFGLTDGETIDQFYVDGGFTYALLNTKELVKITKTNGTVEARIQTLLSIEANHIGGIKKIVIGASENFLVLTHDQVVYTWGANRGYALGTNTLNQEASTTSPRIINGFLTTPVILSTVQVRFGTPIPLITPTLDSFVFKGWYQDAFLTLPYVETTMPAAEVTLYASWVLGVA